MSNHVWFDGLAAAITSYSTMSHTHNSPYALQVDGLRKYYGSFEALKGINLNVRHGEVFGFLGPNGSGKTTTIRCVLDMIRPSEGTIRVLGTDPQTNPVAVQSKVGYLPGELRLHDNLTARQTFKLFDAFRGRVSDWDYILSIAGWLNLSLDKPIKNFSKGNKQKVGVVQAFMHQRELLVLDEPTSGLDPLIWNSESAVRTHRRKLASHFGSATTELGTSTFLQPNRFADSIP